MMKVGDTIEIIAFHPDYSGRKAIVERIDGFDVYIKIPSLMNQRLHLYRNEVRELNE